MYLAVDIGGTKTLVALFTERGRIIRRIKFKTSQDAKTFLKDLSNILTDFKKYPINSIGVAVPGPIQEDCSVKFGNRDWPNIDIAACIKKVFDCPVYIENDASLGALYEGFDLPGRTVFLTFSTGVGGGVVENNRILPESSSFEPGHIIYTYKDESAEWEDLAGATALEKIYHVNYATDLKKKDALQDIAKRIYLGLPDITKKYSPDTIILGGPLGKIFGLYIKYLPNDLKIKLSRPKRPTESVIYGCYLLARQKS